MKYIKDVEKEFRKPSYPVFKSQDLASFKVGRKYRKRMTHLLLSSGRIERITRGIYTFHNDVSVVGFAFPPFYYGFENALTLRGVSLQGTNPMVVTPRNVRQGVRVFKGRNYIVRRIPPKLFFGYNMLKRGNFWMPVSDLEKTVIDMMYFDDYIRGELWPGILEKLDMKRLKEHLKRYKKEFREKMLKTIREERKKVK
jgi:predicted transcriptional regulator of viral defense system